MKYFGHFPTIQCVGSVAYKLLLPSTARIHFVFHVSQLKPCQGVHQQSYIPLPLITNGIGPILQPQESLQSRVILKGDKHIPQVLVHWKGIDAEHATWKELTYMLQAYFDFNLEDKIDFEGGDNVTSGNSTRIIKEMGMEKNNKEVSSDAMIVGNRKSARMRKANSLMKNYVCVRNIIKYIVIERRGEGSGCCILFLFSIISKCYLLYSYLFEFVRLLQ